MFRCRCVGTITEIRWLWEERRVSTPPSTLSLSCMAHVQSEFPAIDASVARGVFHDADKDVNMVRHVLKGMVKSTAEHTVPTRSSAADAQPEAYDSSCNTHLDGVHWITGLVFLHGGYNQPKNALSAYRTFCAHNGVKCVTWRGLVEEMDGARSFQGNNQLARQSLERGAAHGCPTALVSLGFHLARAGDHPEALRLCLEAGEHPEAMARLASMLSSASGGSRGIPEDAPRSLELYQRAASHGYMTALVTLAKMRRREGDAASACEYYKRAARNGHRFALWQVRQVQAEDPGAAVPFGRWRPSAESHRWVPKRIHERIVQVLLGANRSTSDLSRLPRELRLLLISFVVTEPSPLRDWWQPDEK